MNKKLTGLLLLFFLCLLPLNGQAKVKAPKKECHSYVVMDAGSGKVLFGQKANKKIYPASTAKLMNAIVCVENGDLDSVIKTKADIVYNTTPGTYNVGIGAGVKYTFQDLLHISLMASSADATDSLAVGVFGSKKKCVKAMNAKCKELGLTKTSFDNPVGSDIGAGYNKTYSTAKEMALICRYAMAVPAIRSAVKKAHYDTQRGGVSVNTTNWFLRGMAYYDHDSYKIIGSKSGTTNAAGHVFIATAVDDEGHELICAYFGNVSKESTFSSIRSLLDYAFKKYRSGEISLSQSNYDVRISEKYGDAYEEYASLNCYPSEKSSSGKFSPNKAITRSQLALMLEKAGNMTRKIAVESFAKKNSTGKVTALKLAELIAKLYPDSISKEKQEEVLESAGGLSGASDEEKEAFALFCANGFAVDTSCNNAGQIITRGQALLIVDQLSDYQMNYAAAHGQSAQYCAQANTVKAVNAAGTATTQAKATTQAAATTAQAATTQAQSTATAQAATTQAQSTAATQAAAQQKSDQAAEEGSTIDAEELARIDAERQTLEAKNFPVITFNRKWTNILTKQKEERLAAQRRAEQKKKREEKKRQQELKKKQKEQKKKQKEQKKQQTKTTKQSKKSVKKK